MHVFYVILLFCVGAFLSVAVGESSKEVAESDRVWFEQKKWQHELLPNLVPRGHVLRLGPGEDLLESIWRYAGVVKLTAASIVTAVGSLSHTNIRYANQENSTSLSGHFEIVSLVGQVDFQNATRLNEFEITGSGHVHISCSDEKGVTIGGHLVSGNIVYTTAEITLLSFDNAIFKRELDDGPQGSGYYELKVFPEHN